MLPYKRILLSLCLLLSAQWVSAQKVERLYNVSPTDTANNYTVIVKPVSGSPKGWVLLFPGFGESPADVLQETSFPLQAAQAGYAVALPYIGGNTGLLLSDAHQKQIEELVRDIQKKYRLRHKKMAIGGFSMGGTTAVKFAEHSLASSTTPDVAALFAVDPLLDLERFERSVLKAVQRNQSPMPKQMLKMLQALLQKDFGTTPVQDPQQYYTISPYAYADTANTAIKPLKQLPVLLYSKPNVATQFSHNHRDLYDLNTADCTAFMADLQSMGNQEAQLILTSGQGRRADGTANPHSWSILDVEKTINWLQQHLQ